MIKVVKFQDVQQHWNRKTHSWDDPQYVYIGRAMFRYGLPDSPWRNTHKVVRHTKEEHEQAIQRYEADLMNNPALLARLPELRGKTLVCWCDPLPCHGHLLKRLAEQGGDE